MSGPNEQARPGEHVGRYRIIAPLDDGRGFRAHDEELRRDVALRFVSCSPADGGIAQLQHPNVLAIYDIGRHRGQVYVATELVEGVPLRRWLVEARPGWREVLATFQQVGLGLAAAHEKHLFHLDFGADHVIVGHDGRARVSSFSLEQPTNAHDAALADVRAFCVTFDDALVGREAAVWLRKVLAREHASMSAVLDALARRDTSRRTGVILAGAALVATAAVAFVVSRSSTAPACGSAQPVAEAAWGPQQRAALEAAYAKLDASWAKTVRQSVETMLDRYTTTWVAMHHESCEATRVRHRQTQLVLDVRSTCLAQHLDEVREKVAVLISGDRATLERGIEIIRGLPPLASCADVAALTAPVPPPQSSEARTRVETLRKQLARARALIDAAKFGEAARVAASVTGQAAQLKYRPLEAEALYTQSAALERQGDYREAVRTAREASRAANAGRDDQVAAESLISLVWLVGGREHKYAEAHDFAREAAAAIERLDQRATLEGELAGALGSLYANEGQLDEALAQHQRHLALTEQSLGSKAPTLGGILVDIGEVYREQGRDNDALASYERALEIFEGNYGPDHPTVAVPLNNMGIVMHRLGRNQEALDYHKRALALFERTLGKSHPHVAEARTNIGVLLLGEGHPAAAYEEFHRALQIDEGVAGTDSVECAIDHINMADALRDARKLDEATAEAQRAVAIADKAVGPEDPIMAEAHLSLGKTLAARHSPAAAVTELEMALAIWSRPDAEAEAGLGEALAEMGAARLALGQRKAGIDALEQAVRRLETASRDPQVLVTARQLLARARKTK